MQVSIGIFSANIAGNAPLFVGAGVVGLAFTNELPKATNVDSVEALSPWNIELENGV
ncbi:MAG: hypothetical protein MI976_16200 [Pseudomonadales bacterium]|nr:hypothetical protein [Pseudomonadales bacterium]